MRKPCSEGPAVNAPASGGEVRIRAVLLKWVKSKMPSPLKMTPALVVLATSPEIF